MRKMRLLADENIDQSAVVQLRSMGHDVFYAKESSPSANDPYLLRQATRDRRTLFTYDTDYGELVHRHGEPTPYGVIQFRIHDQVQGETRINFIVGAVTIWEQWLRGFGRFSYDIPLVLQRRYEEKGGLSSLGGSSNCSLQLWQNSFQCSKPPQGLTFLAMRRCNTSSLSVLN